MKKLIAMMMVILILTVGFTAMAEVRMTRYGECKERNPITDEITDRKFYVKMELTDGSEVLLEVGEAVYYRMANDYEASLESYNSRFDVKVSQAICNAVDWVTFWN